MTRKFRIATFYTPKAGRPPTRFRVQASSFWYDETLFDEAEDGCIFYDVEAASEFDAKLQAIDLRVEHERAALAPPPSAG